MATTFTWKIERMDCIPTEGLLSNVVVTAYWRCNGVDGAYTGTSYGSCNFDHPGNPFTEYEDLTESQVLGWCWAGGVNQTEQESLVEAQINNQITPPVVSPPLPW